MSIDKRGKYLEQQSQQNQVLKQQISDTQAQITSLKENVSSQSITSKKNSNNIYFAEYSNLLHDYDYFRGAFGIRFGNIQTHVA